MAERATQFSRFDRLSTRYRITGLVVTETGLRIGAGKSLDVATSDQPVIRDGLNRLFLPGSSLKGVLRAGLEAVLRGRADDRLPACDPFVELCTEKIAEKAKKAGKSIELDDVLREICVVCGLFGSPHLAGRVFVADLPLAEEALSRTEVRDGVGIDRDRRVARQKIKYDLEVVPPGTAFRLEILLENVDDLLQLGLVLKTLELLDTGELRLGGLTSRGLGRVSLADLSLGRTDAGRLLAGHPYETLDFTATKAEAEKRIAAVLWPAEEA